MTSQPRLSATVVLVRPGRFAADPWETYLLRRSAQSPVLADNWVFPGGTLRSDDFEPSVASLCPTLTWDEAHAVFSRPPDVPPPTSRESYAHFVAAARELIEEAGVILTGREDAALTRVAIADQQFAARRAALERGQPLIELLRAMGAHLALDQLVYYAHWITPEALPQRFDTRFFLARLPEGHEASPSPFEMVEGLWISAQEALARAKAGSLSLHFATMSHLRRLAPYRSIEELFAFARGKHVVPVMPHTREKEGTIIPFLAPEIEGAW